MVVAGAHSIVQRGDTLVVGHAGIFHLGGEKSKEIASARSKQGWNNNETRGFKSAKRKKYAPGFDES